MKKQDAGVYHNDYSPRYKPAYNIYDKAREHIKKQKREMREKADENSDAKQE